MNASEVHVIFEQFCKRELGPLGSKLPRPHSSGGMGKKAKLTYYLWTVP